MVFDEEFVESLREDPIAGVVEIAKRLDETLDTDGTEWRAEDYEVLLEGLALLDSLEAAKLVSFPFRPAGLSPYGNLQPTCRVIWAFIQHAREECEAQLAQTKYDKIKARFTTSLAAGFVYEFSQGDLDRLQALLQDTRKLVTESEFFTDEHRRRLLLRLEKLQAEVHKKVSSLDHFWGIVVDAGVVMKKVGEDAKPIVDRIREIAGIVWRTQARAEELPSDSTSPLADSPTSAIGSSGD